MNLPNLLFWLLAGAFCGWPDLRAELPVFRADFEKVQVPQTVDSAAGLKSILPGASSAPGRAYTPLHFDGTSFLSFTDRPTFHISGPFSIETWCRPDSDDGRYLLLKKHHFGFPCFNGNGDVSWYMRWDKGKDMGGQIQRAVNIGQWQHYAFTYDGKQARVFRNGKLVHTRTLQIHLENSANPILVGTCQGWGTKDFQGDVGLLRLYNSALGPEFVRSQYARLRDGKTVPVPESLLLEVVPRPNVNTGRALHFDGEESRVEFPDAPQLNPGAALTAGAWVYPDKAPAGSIILKKGSGTDSGYALKTAPRGGLLGLITTGEGEHRIVAERALREGAWQTVALCWDGAAARLFVNDCPAGRPAVVRGTLKESEGPLFIGGAPETPGFRGLIDEVRIWKVPIHQLPSLPSEIGDEVVQPASNTDPDGIEGKRSRHLAGLKEKRRPLVDFENLEGWRVVSARGISEGVLCRSRAEKLWGEYVAKLSYHPGPYQGSDGVKILPPSPIPIRQPFDAINLWVFANYWRPPPHPTLSVEFEDAEGRRHSVALGSIQRIWWRGWLLVHRALDQRFETPARFLSITLRGVPREDTFYLDSLSFYQQSRGKLAAQTPAWEDLPCPTTPDTILPSLDSATPFHNGLKTYGKGLSFVYEGREETVEYSYSPKTGTFSDIAVSFNRQSPFQPMKGGGLVLDVDGQTYQPDDARVKRTLVAMKIAGDLVSTSWRWEVAGEHFPVQLDLSIRQKSLVVDIRAETGLVSEVRFGACSGVEGVQLVEVPYLVLRGRDHPSRNPAILSAPSFFLSGFVDWYKSSASELFGDQESIGTDRAVYNGGAAYIPRTDGKRNSVRERLFLTVSRLFSEVLPNIPNPPSPYSEVTRKSVWVTRSWYMEQKQYRDIVEGRAPAYFDQEYAFWRKVRDYGVENLIIRQHVNLYRQYLHPIGDPYTLVQDLAPEVGGDKAGIDFFRRMQKQLGFRIGLYTNYTLVPPLSHRYWDENLVCLRSDGQWKIGSLASYMLKPSQALRTQELFNTQLKAKFNPAASYADQYTCRPVWGSTDYDARVPEAGMFSPAYRVFAKLLRTEADQFQGPVLSEGIMHWIFAGLADSYAQPSDPDQPMLVDFQLLKLHPLSNDCGYHLRWVSGRGHVDRLLAAEIAYGHIGHLYGLYGGQPPEKVPAELLKSYFMIHELQKLYARVPVISIRYEHQGRLVNTETAIRTLAYLKGRVQVKYANGLEVHVNRGESDWRVTADNQDLVLPPNGWAAWLPGRFFEYSAKVDGARADYVLSSRTIYCDGRGQQTDFGPLRAAHAYVLKHVGKDWRLIPAPFQKEERIALRPYRLFGNAAHLDAVQIIPETARGAANGPLKVTRKDRRIEFTIDRQALAYRIVWQLK